MILLCGINSEPPLALVREALDRRRARYVSFNQRQFSSMAMEMEIVRGQLSGNLRVNGDSYPLGDFDGVFNRLMDYRFLPELQDLPETSAEHRLCRNLMDTVTRWSELADIRVVNKIAPMTSNFSKPFQAQIIRQHGFEIPPTLITNDPELVREFRAQHKKIVYKSISGVRSIVQTFTDADMDRLENIRWCPTQFQAFIEGTNVRVHTIGQKLFATAITTAATDYRYAARQSGEPAELREVDLSDELADMCLKLSAAMGLAFAGIDLKITSEKHVYCFEVNPSPAFSYYQGNTGQPIAEAVAGYLMGD
jgi:glutathione synthase/RimK-type ligase-like ATP-grasp enzyme